MAGNGDGYSWWCACIQLQGPAVGACVMARTSYRHTCSGMGQGQWQGLGPPAGVLVVVAAGSCHRLHTTVEAGDKSWTGREQMHSWRAYLHVSPAVQASDWSQDRIWADKWLWRPWLFVCTAVLLKFNNRLYQKAISDA